MQKNNGKMLLNVKDFQKYKKYESSGFCKKVHCLFF